MDESNTIIVFDDGTNLLFGLSSTMTDSKEGMEPPNSLIMCNIMCSTKDKEIVELKDRLHTLSNSEMKYLQQRQLYEQQQQRRF